jgi:translation initiation factor IF-2
MQKQEIGKVTHFFSKVSVGLVMLSAPLKVGDKISIEGAHTNFEQTVESIRIEQDSLTEAAAGQKVGIKVSDRVRENDTVFKVIE